MSEKPIATYGCDIWAIGLCAVALLNGEQSVFRIGFKEFVLRAIKRGDHINGIPEDTSDDFKQIIIDCFDRYISLYLLKL